MRAYLYILSSSPSPDRCEQSVPFAIDDHEIFFGPCKKRLRHDLGREFLGPTCDSVAVDEEIYFVGFNGSDGNRTRKIVWAGRLTRVMTFARAADALIGPRYQRMRELDDSPLHVTPNFGSDGALVGYWKVGGLHQGDWHKDLAEHTTLEMCEADEAHIITAPGYSAWDSFPRDACMFLANIFYARGAGIDVDDDVVDILKRAQPDRAEDVGSYDIFGVQENGDANGRRGSWLELSDPLSRAMLAIIRVKEAELRALQKPLSELPDKVHRCSCDPIVPSAEVDC